MEVVDQCPLQTSGFEIASTTTLELQLMSCEFISCVTSLKVTALSILAVLDVLEVSFLFAT